jgi:beta-glucanase (GH16 family)
VWNDEFDGGNVDRNKWRFEQGAGGWGNNELQYYTDRQENARVTGGNLIITARKESYGGASHTSTRIITSGHFSITYGKFEMRAKLPRGQGMWPAFWLLGDNISTVGWPACGEIDIMEYIGREPNMIYGSLHAPQFDVTGGYKGSGFSDEFHTYAVNWQPNQIDFMVDNNIYKSVNKSQSGGHWPFEGKNFFILLNLAVGGNWPGYPDGST